MHLLRYNLKYSLFNRQSKKCIICLCFDPHHIQNKLWKNVPFLVLTTRSKATWKRQPLLLHQVISHHKTQLVITIKEQKMLLLTYFTIITSNFSLKLIQYKLVAIPIQVKFFITFINSSQVTFLHNRRSLNVICRLFRILCKVCILHLRIWWYLPINK